MSPIVNFLLGFVVGMVFAFLESRYYSLETSLIYRYSVGSQTSHSVRSETAHSVRSETVHSVGSETPHSYLNSRTGPKINSLHNKINKREEAVQELKSDDVRHHHDNDEIAERLSKQIRILCLVITSPSNLNKKAIHVKKTWGKRCTKLLFFSSETNISFPSIGLNTSEGRQHLTAKTMQALRYVHDNFFNEADWFLKADDDTYVIMENLRYFLSSQNTNDPVYFGHHFVRKIVKQGFYSGGAGYVLGKEALKRIATTGSNPQFCKQDGIHEDLELGKCMEKLRVKIVNTTDILGRTRFHCYKLEDHLFGRYPQWYYYHDANGAKKNGEDPTLRSESYLHDNRKPNFVHQTCMFLVMNPHQWYFEGMNSISEYAISFHYVHPSKMYELEFYVYHLHPYGIDTGHQDLNQQTKVFNTNNIHFRQR